MSDRAPFVPVTVEEHREAYREHKARADELLVKLERQTATAVLADPTTTALEALREHGRVHRATVAEYHDELMCAAKHFALAAVLETVT